jgi:predicted DNA-binding transcriptional regulator YafY
VATGENFEPNLDPPLPEIRYTPNEDDAHVTIRLAEDAWWVAEHYPVDVVDHDDGTKTIKMSVSDPAVAARLLLRLGDSADLVEGQEAQEALTDLRERILARYDATDGMTTGK